MSEITKWECVLLDAAEKSTGAGTRTARQDRLLPGRAASERMAATDWPTIRLSLAMITNVAGKYDLPAVLVCGIISRESRAGNALDARGWGDHGRAFGVMQVDARFHVIIGEDPWEDSHVAQGCKILRNSLLGVMKMHPHWPTWAQLRGAIAAYNFGVRNVRTIDGIDKGTTGNDYSSDVCCRARWYHESIARLLR